MKIFDEEIKLEILRTKRYIPFIVMGVIFVVLMVIIPNPFIPTNNDWIGFYGGVLGSLLGGYVTFAAVKQTITHEKSLKNDSELLSIKPFININVEELSNQELYNDFINKAMMYDVKIGDKYSSSAEEQMFYSIFFSNIGRDSAVLLRVFIGTDKLEDSFDEVRINKSALEKGGETGCFAVAVAIDINAGFWLRTEFADLLGNQYEQFHFFFIGYYPHMGQFNFANNKKTPPRGVGFSHAPEIINKKLNS